MQVLNHLVYNNTLKQSQHLLLLNQCKLLHFADNFQYFPCFSRSLQGVSTHKNENPTWNHPAKNYFVAEADFPLQRFSYLPLGQLIIEDCAIAKRKRLNVLLPLPCLSEPADEPVVAPAVNAHVSSKEVELPLPQINLCKNSLPALQEAFHQLAVMFQLSVTLPVDPRHLVIDNGCLSDNILQSVKNHLVGFCLGMHRLSGRRAKSSLWNWKEHVTQKQK